MMSLNKYFDIYRIANLMRRSAILNTRMVLIAFAAIGGLLLIVFLSDTFFHGDINYTPMMNLFHVILFAGGFIFTSQSFNELQKPEKGYHYLTLPASHLEKLFTKWLFSTIIYLVAAYLALYVIALIGSGLSVALLKADFKFPALQNYEPFRMAGIYLVLQPIFLLGAAYFKRHSFLKTLLTIIVIALITGIFTTIASYILFGSSGLESSNFAGSNTPIPHIVFTETIPHLSKILFWYVMGPFFLIVSYFRLTERQV
jgi:hypothetical protein